MELRSYGVKELSQMLGCRVDDKSCQLINSTTLQLINSITHEHINSKLIN